MDAQSYASRIQTLGVDKLSGSNVPELEREIRAIPGALKDSLTESRSAAEELAGRIANAGKVVFIGSGSSYNAALPAVWALNSCGFPAWVYQATDVRNYGPAFPSDAVPVLISVSGEGDEITGAADAIESRYCQTCQAPAMAVVCNTPGSTLVTKYGREKVMTRAGKQLAEAATHTMLSSMAVLLQVAALTLRDVECKAGFQGSIRLANSILEWLNVLPEVAQTTVEASFAVIPEVVQGFGGSEANNITVVGSGPSYAAALDGALKIRETAQVYAEGYCGENVLHGPAFPIAYYRHPVTVLGSPESRYAASKVAYVMAGLGCPVFFVDVTGKEDGILLEKPPVKAYYREMRVDSTMPEALVPVITSIPLEVMALELGRVRGLQVDVPPTKAEQKRLTAEFLANVNGKKR